MTTVPPCPVCSTIGDDHYAFQKGGRESEATFLPPAVDRLTDLGQVEAPNCRVARLLTCPHCAAWFLYRSDYEFLVYGTEDEQWLTRIGPAEAEAYRRTLKA